MKINVIQSKPKVNTVHLIHPKVVILLIILKENYLKCIHSFKTNPITCSKSTDIPCFYDQYNNICIPFLDNKEYISVSQFKLEQQNIIQFINVSKIFLRDYQDNYEECFEVQEAELRILKCSDKLNENGCVNIQTSFQLCQYENYICKAINLDSPNINTNCSYYQKINSSGYLLNNNRQSFVNMNISNKRCQELTQASEVDCDQNQTQNKGYNGLACNKNNNCIFYDGTCYNKIGDSIAFCSDVDSTQIQLCKEIITQGCTVTKDRCISLLPNNYMSIKCNEAVNIKGCIQIQTPGQTCFFDQYLEICKFQNLYIDFKSKCLELNNINSFKFCEQTTDQPCKYNLMMNKCEIAAGNNYDCIRGLNKMACYNLTDKSQQCKYLNYCYGPNDKILECNPNNYYDCCREALTKESCLFQKRFECQWQNGCQAYQQKIQNECNQIKDASVTVCTSIKDSFCIFDAENFNCKQITPESCDEIQTSDQCNKITEYPCIWDELNEICIYKDKDILDQCTNISDNNGNLKACTMIERSGQKCIFIDNQCKTFYQKDGINNCINNINITSCLQQNVSPCEWVIEEVKVKKTKDITKMETIKIGECQQFTDFDNRDCNLLLSQKSCISVRKLGQFCRWKNNQCQNFSLSDYQINKYRQPELAQIVNPNVCGLYQDQRLIQYSQELASCIEVKDSSKLSCQQSKYGLNSVSCFKIQSESCKWNPIHKTCEQVTINNTNLTISCDLPGLNSKAFAVLLATVVVKQIQMLIANIKDQTNLHVQQF
ncbi:unnamed protein product (macronuclear) [Paramecium tetraurelia]|uniref:Transmembrane protein n=1 Tax=Paramecium tetraurelia TaxID=5888 RepID=A0CHR0_PARTE|nr:uncharacterized protein GSPATT00038429001 [Paramecium tetraurelia]CAK70327.1 unnamed protein product [Paramecium tetraurelia]|eukprot:XP_001437724.1 hypothetical protein (macronuclear) [Paramecium tetraurelia strain d4-2]